MSERNRFPETFELSVLADELTIQMAEAVKRGDPAKELKGWLKAQQKAARQGFKEIVKFAWMGLTPEQAEQLRPFLVGVPAFRIR
jgi:hypothetical protein